MSATTTYTQEDLDLGAKAIRWTIRALSLAATTACWISFGWFVALLLTLLVALAHMAARIAVCVMVSDETFGSIGSKLGYGIGRIQGLFSK